jgi:MoxR-vWA-beta-propeller ternary system protein
VNFSWAICLARTDASALGALRLIPDVEAAEAGPLLWLRSRRSGEAIAARLAALPAIARYEWLPPDLLRRIDQRISAERLAELRWQSLQAWLKVELPAAAIPARAPEPVPLRLVRSSMEREPELLLTAAEEWQRFATQAPRVRLERLQFAADAEGRIIIRGRPLPPVPGSRYVIHDAVAVPMGLAWQPAVSAEIVSRLAGAGGEALALWHEDGTITRLHAEQFVPATRSAVRDTVKALADLDEP